MLNKLKLKQNLINLVSFFYGTIKQSVYEGLIGKVKILIDRISGLGRCTSIFSKLFLTVM